MTATVKLDPRETHWRIPGWYQGRSLFLRHLPAIGNVEAAVPVLYVHGATFASALSIAYRFDGRSWRDELCAAGFDVWALDFHGFGGLSDPYPELAAAPDGSPPLCRTADASRQLEAAIRFVRQRHHGAAVSLVAHSWGTMVAGDVAARCPDLVGRLVLFGPIARRLSTAPAVRLPAWRLITVRDQWDRFTADVPSGSPAVLSPRHFEAWAAAWLDTDPAARGRQPASVAVPAGPLQDIADAWAGSFPYDPARVRAPVAIIRGGWDSMCTDADANWLLDALAGSPVRRDVKIARGTHLMHLEETRYALYREAETFLRACDIAPAECHFAA